MTAPTRPPNYFSAIGGMEEDHEYFVGALVDDVARIPKWFPDWMVDNETKIPVLLTLVEHEEAQRAVLQWQAGGQVGTLTAARDPSGWLVITAEHNGIEVFRGYIERIYEEYEVWPSGSGAAEPQIESPGRIGKKQAWVSLKLAAWPLLAPIAENDWVGIREDEEKYMTRKESEPT